MYNVNNVKKCPEENKYKFDDKKMTRENDENDNDMLE
jgi:hypothetical protein